MRNLLLTLALIAILCATVSAQAVKPITFYAGGGTSIPSGDFGLMQKNGYHGLGAVGFNVAPMIQFMLKGEYHSWKTDNPLLGFDFSTMFFGGSFRFSPNLPVSPIKPFGIAGGGLASSKTQVVVLNNNIGDVTSSNFYFEIGGGLDFKIAPMASLFVQGRFVSINYGGGSLNYIPITVGLKF